MRGAFENIPLEFKRGDAEVKHAMGDGAERTFLETIGEVVNYPHQIFLYHCLEMMKFLSDIGEGTILLKR